MIQSVELDDKYFCGLPVTSSHGNFVTVSPPHSIFVTRQLRNAFGNHFADFFVFIVRGSTLSHPMYNYIEQRMLLTCNSFCPLFCLHCGQIDFAAMVTIINFRTKMLSIEETLYVNVNLVSEMAELTHGNFVTHS